MVSEYAILAFWIEIAQMAVLLGILIMLIVSNVTIVVKRDDDDPVPRSISNHRDVTRSVIPFPAAEERDDE